MLHSQGPLRIRLQTERKQTGELIWGRKRSVASDCGTMKEAMLSKHQHSSILYWESPTTGPLSVSACFPLFSSSSSFSSTSSGSSCFSFSPSLSGPKQTRGGWRPMWEEGVDGQGRPCWFPFGIYMKVPLRPYRATPPHPTPPHIYFLSVTVPATVTASRVASGTKVAGVTTHNS